MDITTLFAILRRRLIPGLAFGVVLGALLGAASILVAEDPPRASVAQEIRFEGPLIERDRYALDGQAIANGIANQFASTARSAAVVEVVRERLAPDVEPEAFAERIFVEVNASGLVRVRALGPDVAQTTAILDAIVTEASALTAPALTSSSDGIELTTIRQVSDPVATHLTVSRGLVKLAAITLFGALVGFVGGATVVHVLSRRVSLRSDVAVVIDDVLASRSADAAPVTLDTVPGGSEFGAALRGLLAPTGSSGCAVALIGAGRDEVESFASALNASGESSVVLDVAGTPEGLPLAEAASATRTNESPGASSTIVLSDGPGSAALASRTYVEFVSTLAGVTDHVLVFGADLADPRGAAVAARPCDAAVVVCSRNTLKTALRETLERVVGPHPTLVLLRD